MSTFGVTTDMLRSLKSSSGIKVGRSFEGFFADRLVQALAEPTLMDAVERMARIMDSSIEYVGGKKTAAFFVAARAHDAPAVLAWMRQHPRIVAMLCMLRDDDYTAAIDSIVIDEVQSDDSCAIAAPAHEICIVARCLSPLAHGSDQKAGNATLFRRRKVITPTGRTMDLPFYAGNAIRGQIRDLLADDLTESLGFPLSRTEPVWALWFFHSLYSGGVLAEGGGKDTSKIEARLGKNGAMRTAGLRDLRNMLPGLSTLGAAMGNAIIAGRWAVGDLRPECREWGTGAVSVHSLLEHQFLTRRDDHDLKGQDGQEHAGMIATTETLREGTVLRGGIDQQQRGHASELERSALGRGLQLLSERGYLGAENRRGHGKVEITIDGMPDPAQYIDDLISRKAEIIDWLRGIGALAEEDVSARNQPDLIGT